MSDNIGIKGVRGIVYACILRDSKDYSSKPIVAGLLTFNDQKEMSWDQFRASGSHFGANLYCKTVIFQKETMTKGIISNSVIDSGFMGTMNSCKSTV